MKRALIVITLTFVVAACQKKTEAPDDPMPDYLAAPTNAVADAIQATTSALNARDSVAFWHSISWQGRSQSSNDTLMQRASRRLWDSSAGSHLDVRLLHSEEYAQLGEAPETQGTFAHAVISITTSGKKQAYYDSLTALLRVENGKWVLSTYSQKHSNIPF